VCNGSGIQPDPGLFYIYELPVALTANVVGQQAALQINQAAFKWMFANQVSTGNYAVQITDGSTNRPFSNQPVHVNNLFGTAQNPFPLLTPYMFNTRGAIQAVLNDLSGAPNNVRMAFAGVELTNS
jgi:hypothetical protein